MGEGSSSAWSPGLPSVPVPVLGCAKADRRDEMCGELQSSSVRSLEISSRTSETCSWVVLDISRLQGFQRRYWKEAVGRRMPWCR